jgi:hypothetical protein
MPIPILHQWVKGHFSGKHRGYEQDLNHDADRLASKNVANQPPPYSTEKCPLTYPGCREQIIHNKSIIISKMYNVLSTALHEHHIINYILRKIKWDTRVFDMVDRKAHNMAFHCLTRAQHIQMAKLIQNLANANKNRQNQLYYNL